MQRGLVRPIQYEIVSGRALTGRLARAVQERLGAKDAVAVVHVVDHAGANFTAVGDVDHLLHLIATGAASDPGGTVLRRRKFPVLLPGWLLGS